MNKTSGQVGIIGYGVALPAFRLTAEEIAGVWHADSSRLTGLNIQEKTVADVDEDATTLATTAALRTLQATSVDAERVRAMYIGSESHPYAVKPTSSIVANAIGMSSEYFAVDLEFACKAGTAAMQIVNGLLLADQIDYGFAIGSDTAQSLPNDPLEYSAASGAVAYLLGRGDDSVIATIDATLSFNSDTPDFWRASRAKYPEHGGRFTGKPAYFRHVLEATKNLLDKTKTNVEDYDHVVFHMPNGAFPKTVAGILGVTKEQLHHGLVVPKVGNFYSGSSLVGLANVLDNAGPGERILMTSYGSGAGSDSFALTVTDAIRKYKPEVTVQQLIGKREVVTYTDYLVMRGKLGG